MQLPAPANRRGAVRGELANYSGAAPCHTLAHIRPPTCARLRRVTELLHDATKRLSFIRTLVPPHLRPDFADGTQQGFQQYVVRDGQVEDGAARRKEKAKYSNWRQGNLDPDDVAKHHDQMRRFQFMDRPGGPPPGPVWS